MHTCTLLLFKHCCYWKLIWSFSFYISLYISIVSIRIFLLMRMFLSSFSFRRNFTSNALSSVHIYLNCQWILSSITIKNLTRHFRHNFTDANFLYTSLHIIDNRKWIFSFLIFHIFLLHFSLFFSFNEKLIMNTYSKEIPKKYNNLQFVILFIFPFLLFFFPLHLQSDELLNDYCMQCEVEGAVQTSSLLWVPPLPIQIHIHIQIHFCNYFVSLQSEALPLNVRNTSTPSTVNTRLRSSLSEHFKQCSRLRQ